MTTTPSGYDVQSIYCIIFGRQYLVFDILLVSSSLFWEDIYLSMNQRGEENSDPVGQVWWDIGEGRRENVPLPVLCVGLIAANDQIKHDLHTIFQGGW